MEAPSFAFPKICSLSIPTAMKGWAVGQYGTILHTEDGGRTWKSQENPVKFMLSDVQFIDEKIGWACGYKAIIKTQDKGETWIRLKPPLDYMWKDLFLINKNEGWVVGEFSTILHTADGGKTWQVQHTGEDLILNSVSFSDRRHGWAVGELGVIFSTNNGGKTWVKQRSPQQRRGRKAAFGFTGDTLWQVKARSNKEAWACGIKSTILHTRDGGKTWNKLNCALRLNFSVMEKPSLFTISFWKGKVIVGGVGILAISDDGGKTWEKMEPNSRFKYGRVYKVLTTDEEIYVVSNKGIIRSRDGETWEKIF